MQFQTIDEFRQFQELAGTPQQLTEADKIVKDAELCFNTRDQLDARLQGLTTAMLQTITGVRLGDTLLWLNGLVQEKGEVVGTVVHYKPNGGGIECCWMCRVTSPPASAGNTRHGSRVLVTPDMSPRRYSSVEVPQVPSEWMTPDPDPHQG